MFFLFLCISYLVKSSVIPAPPGVNILSLVSSDLNNKNFQAKPKKRKKKKKEKKEEKKGWGEARLLKSSLH